MTYIYIGQTNTTLDDNSVNIFVYYLLGIDCKGKVIQLVYTVCISKTSMVVKIMQCLQ